MSSTNQGNGEWVKAEKIVRHPPTGNYRALYRGQWYSVSVHSLAGWFPPRFPVDAPKGYKS